MPSPCPGMNPYLEQPDVWHDFHQRFVAWLGDDIARSIRPAYVTKIDAPYRGTPRPPLFSADAKWAEEVLRKRE